MVAEELFFGETSTGVASDLQAATSAAVRMVGSFGMAGSLVSFDAMTGPGGITNRVLGDEAGRARVETILESSRDQVRSVLAANRSVIEALRDELLAENELIGPRIGQVIDAAIDRQRGLVIDVRAGAGV
jgi:cell division protease FtsH